MSLKCSFMLNSGVKIALPISVFFHQKMRNQYLRNDQKREEKSFRVLKGDSKNEMLGPSGPPYALKCWPVIYLPDPSYR